MADDKYLRALEQLRAKAVGKRGSVVAYNANLDDQLNEIVKITKVLACIDLGIVDEKAVHEAELGAERSGQPLPTSTRRPGIV